MTLTAGDRATENLRRFAHRARHWMGEADSIIQSLENQPANQQDVIRLVRTQAALIAAEAVGDLSE